MVVTGDQQFGSKGKRPRGYKVAGANSLQLRKTAETLIPFLQKEGCFQRGEYFLDANHLLENVLQRAGYNYHVAEDAELTDTAAFTIPEEHLIVIKQEVYDGLARDDPFSRFTVVHEFSHIYLKHSVTLHRNATLGNHEWWEDSEWQANNLAAELMIPMGAVNQYGQQPLLLMAECGVSAPSVAHRLDNVAKRGWK
ncbi:MULTISPECIES: ImmA/IrrE family metallo-endopeptidase [Burkholderia]|uniref:ImmA/IrrE family metallo-endopeptidase n=1 Tax=Burkholderia TaxID=32008 RepID=UPI0001A4AD9D|nr:MULTISPECIES: ImmA/IrrE family metallo-endopeptidase [Burkholderia]ACR27582.1 putative neutral zinc metallopeptidase [Burkholderia glumae BGR1]SOT45112.1 putative neutral zinc metallopeptidase [Burkholderia cenocepacia]